MQCSAVMAHEETLEREQHEVVAQLKGGDDADLKAKNRLTQAQTQTTNYASG
jgi:hypothetical protein